MSDERRGMSDQEREASLQQAFDEVAGGLDVRLEPASRRARTVGVAIAIAPMVEFDLEDAPPPAEHVDDQAIKSLIQERETLSPTDFQQQWRDQAHDPHIGVTLEGIAQVDQQAIDAWLASDKFAEFLALYPPYSPRRIKISQVRIVYIGRTRACATYRVREQYTNGKVLAGNVAVILAKIDNVGWRIVVSTKGGREETGQSA